MSFTSRLETIVGKIESLQTDVSDSGYEEAAEALSEARELLNAVGFANDSDEGEEEESDAD